MEQVSISTTKVAKRIMERLPLSSDVRQLGDWGQLEREIGNSWPLLTNSQQRSSPLFRLYIRPTDAVSFCTVCDLPVFPNR